jgi:hypothetical protein
MPKSVLTLARRSSQVAVLVTLALSLAQAQRTQPAISLVRTTPAIAAASDSANFWGQHSESRAIQENYREFPKTKVARVSAPQVFNFEFHSATAITGIAASQEFRVSGGTCAERQAYFAGNSCTVEVVFTPKGPGHRTGQLSITHSASATTLLTPLGGLGYGPAIQFIPSLISTVPNTFKGTGTAAAGVFLGPQNIATDGGDNLYVADTGDSLIYFEDSSGTFSVFAGGGTASAVGYSGFGSGVKLTGPRGIGVDYSGTVYFSSTGDDVFWCYISMES